MEGETSMSKSTISTFELFQMFPDQETARLYLESRLWANGVTCPTCRKGDRITTRKGGYYRCNACQLDFTVRTGTIFERSHIPLHKWLYAMYLLVTAREGISSLQLAKEIGVTQKSAWFMLQRLREACGPKIDRLRGMVEIDGAVCGRKAKLVDCKPDGREAAGEPTQDDRVGRWAELRDETLAADPELAHEDIRKFVSESNRIEGIYRDPTLEEVEEHKRFVALKVVTVEDLEAFVRVYQPNARLRVHAGLNVRVGNYRPPAGGANILTHLDALVDRANRLEDSPYAIHCAYEKLHPFTDGNGRSGRALWAWQMERLGGCPLGFLHHFYYQALEASR